MAQSLTDSSADVRQAASYGVGVAAKAGGPSYASFCSGKVTVLIIYILASIPHLFAMINAADSRNEENIMATENSISALAKIIRTYKDAGLFDSNSMISMWIGELPIVEDCEEAPETYQLLLDLIMQQHPAVVNATQAPALVSILTQVLSIPSLLPNNPELSQQLLAALRSIVPACNKQELISRLSNEQQQFLVKQGL